MADIKSLLNSIIDDGDHDRPITAANPTGNPYVKFNTTDFREKLSLHVLHDIIAAMMADDVKDVEGMIDEAILRHIKNDYKGTCFGYLRNARDKLNSPLFGDIVQEIEDKTEEARQNAMKGIAEKDPAAITNALLDGVENWDEFRERVGEIVKNKVVYDVTNSIVGSNKVPVFDGIDQKITVDKNESNKDLMNAPQQAEPQPQQMEPQPAMQQQESVIIKMCGNIVTEQALLGNRITTEEGIERAIITYCLGEMDSLTKQDPSRKVMWNYLK